MIEETLRAFLSSIIFARPDRLIRQWRGQAAQYDRDGVTASARLLLRVADELEALVGRETVTLAEAARRSGTPGPPARSCAPGTW